MVSRPINDKNIQTKCMESYTIIVILECLYLYFMFRCFKTTTNLTYQWSPAHTYLKHPTASAHPELQVCQFGQDAILILLIILLLQLVYPIDRKWIKISLGISLLLSFMNLNAFVYLLPICLLELYQ